MKKNMKIGLMSLFMLLMSLNPITASQTHVIYEVDWVSEEAGIVQLKWSDDSTISPIMIQSWSQNIDGEIIIRYATGNNVPPGFSQRRIEAQNLKTPFRIILLKSSESKDTSAFSDMPLTEEGKKAIQMLYDLGVLNGYSDGTIKPNQSVSRAEFTKMLYLATGMSEESSTGFADVPPEHWAQKYIQTLAAKGIVQGKGQGRFDPNGTITVGELATILNRTFTLYNQEDSYPYASNGHWSFSYFNQLVNQGIIYPRDSFYYPYMPDQLATRQDCSILLTRILLKYHEIVE